MHRARTYRVMTMRVVRMMRVVRVVRVMLWTHTRNGGWLEMDTGCSGRQHRFAHKQCSNAGRETYRVVTMRIVAVATAQSPQCERPPPPAPRGQARVAAGLQHSPRVQARRILLEQLF